MLTGGHNERVDIPHEPGQWMTIRGLSWWQLKEAADVLAAEGRRQLRDYGPETLTALREARQRDDIPQAIREAMRDPLTDYDRATVLRYGIVGWSYSDDSGDELAARTVDLDEDTAVWAAHEIIDRSRLSDEKRGKSNASSNGIIPAGSLTSSPDEPIAPPEGDAGR